MASLLLLPPASLLFPWDSCGGRGPRKAGDQTWKPNRLPRTKWAGETPVAPPHLPCLFLPLPPMPLGPMWPGGGPWRAGYSALGSLLGFPLSSGPGRFPPTLSACPLPPPPSLPDSRTHEAGGCPRERRTRPGSPAGFLGPEWVGETPATPLLILQLEGFSHPPLLFSPHLPPMLLGPT